jgi:hypothetical protein
LAAADGGRAGRGTRLPRPAVQPVQRGRLLDLVRARVDSRLDPYPLPFLLEHIRVEQGAPHEDLFARWAIRCALLPVDSPIHAQLRDARWRPLHVDGQFVVMGRP